MCKENIPKISVIIPTYNSENTILRCIKSIQSQTYNNLEIIIVNDGSKDNTERIVNELKRIDSRIKLISISNGGVSHARNTGIENATGEYITFVDSDDTIKRDMYEHLIWLMDEYNAQIAHCSYNNYVDDKFDSSVGNVGKIVEMNHDEALSCLLSGRYFAGGMCNKLYSISLFNNLRLDENIKINEDVLMNFELFNKTNKSVYSDKALYNYYQIPTSSSHSTNYIQIGEESLYVANKMFDLSKGKSYEREAKIRVAGISLGLYQTYKLSHDKSIKLKEKNLKASIIENNKNKFYIRRNDKIKYIMLRYIPCIYIGLYKIYDKLRKPKIDPKQ